MSAVSSRDRRMCCGGRARKRVYAVDDGEPNWATNCEGKRHTLVYTFRRTEYIFCSSFLFFDNRVVAAAHKFLAMDSFAVLRRTKCAMSSLVWHCCDWIMCWFTKISLSIHSEWIVSVRPFGRRALNNDCHQPPGPLCCLSFSLSLSRLPPQDKRIRRRRCVFSAQTYGCEWRKIKCNLCFVCFCVVCESGGARDVRSLFSVSDDDCKRHMAQLSIRAALDFLVPPSSTSSAELANMPGRQCAMITSVSKLQTTM